MKLHPGNQFSYGFKHADFMEFLRRVAAGRTVRSVCADPDMPSRQSVARYKHRNKAFRKKYEEIWEKLPLQLALRSLKRPKSLKAKVRALRRMSRRQKAAVLGINHMTVHRIERGRPP